MTKLPQAVLWDMDGTLVDSEPYWMQAEMLLTKNYGVTWTQEDAMSTIGNQLSVTAELLQERGVPLSVEEILTFVTGQVGAQLARQIPWQPGALQCLQAFSGAGIQQALVTMSYRNVAQNMLDAAEDGLIQTSICGDEVELGKPDPMPYLQAAEKLGVDIAECVVVEDSPAGIAAGVASGARVIGVQAEVPVVENPKISRFDTLERLDLPMLAEVLSGKKFDFLD